VAAAAETVPRELRAGFDLVTVHLPWGSLLRGVVCTEAWWTGTLRRLLRPRGRAELLLSVVERDGAVPPLDAAAMVDLAAAYSAAGLRPLEVHMATPEEAAERSTWARRIGAGTSDRPAWFVTLAGPERPA
jgi:hypothetical protein